MTLHHLVALILFGTSYWVHVPDHANRVHEALINTHGKVAGELVQAHKGDSFQVACWGQSEEVVVSRELAEQFVRDCPAADWSGRP